MQAKPVSINQDVEPIYIISVYQDRNGNWFASCRSKVITCCTPTYTEKTEAIMEAMNRLGIEKGGW